MKADRVPLDSGVPSPDADVWEQVETHTRSLSPVPLDAVDTSKYVRQTIDPDSIGVVDSVSVQVACDDDRLAIRLTWTDPTPDRTVAATEDFADKAAVAFPIEPGASVMSMGSCTAPIDAWYWRADRSRPYDVIGRGFGDVDRREAAVSGLGARATYADGRWRLVLSRERPGDGDEFVDLGGESTGIAVAIWDGNNRERGPLKSYSGEFERLELR